LRERKLPSARLIATAEYGLINYAEAGNSCLPPLSLFAKPTRANGGRGAERWNFADGSYRSTEGVTLSAKGLAVHFAKLSKRQPYLVQECLQNHPVLNNLSAGALSTLRMYTIWNENGDVEHIFSMLRMSRNRRSAVDNVCRGGLAAAVDFETGALGRATDGSILAETGGVDRHPVTGAQITGLQIPFLARSYRLGAVSASLIIRSLYHRLGHGNYSYGSSHS
jgi:Sugar-transfer associated ATP-grasp